MIDFILEIPLFEKIASLDALFIKKPAFSQKHSTDEYEFIAWGDPLLSAGFSEVPAPDVKSIVNTINGHFYFILWYKRANRVTAGNSLFSILPVYYWQGPDKLVLSANALMLGEHIDKRTFSRRFVLETILFNYPLFNSSVIEGVNLLPANSAITVASGKAVIEKHTNVEDFYGSEPRSWKNSIDDISDRYLQAVKKYLPDHFYVNALTGGFDGRTLTASGLFHKKDFACYCFGSSSSNDMRIASKLAATAGIPFIRVDLDEEYTAKSSLDCGLELIRNASGTATFARAHYLHAAKLLAGRTEHIVTGNFGSEIFRAAHVPGAVISANLYHLFNTTGLEPALQKIAASEDFEYLNRSRYQKEWSELKEDLATLPCFISKYKDMSRNRQFYIFVFEEIFRKYFGAEMFNQFHYVKNRTPFLDWEFMRALMRTGLAGIHSKYFEHNPIKRYKGQVVYARIIRRAFPEFGRIMTDKGYRPDDLLSIGGKLRISGGYLKKVLHRRKLAGSDPYAVAAAFEKNRRRLSQVKIDPEWFNEAKIKNEMLGKPHDALFKPLSLAYLKELTRS